MIDHVVGARRGQRQELALGERIRFGRHPVCEVAFDQTKDNDASSRHAELRPVPAGWILVDLGSSNGTYVDGHRITETAIPVAAPVMIEFGAGGPRLRLFIGDDAAIEALPPPVLEARRTRGLAIGLAIAIAVVAAVALGNWLRS